MQYVEYGAHNSQTIILLHGGGLSWWNYREVAQLLADKYHVVLPILDGYADSDAPFTSIEDNAARLIAFLQSNSAYSIKPALRDTQAKVHIVFGSKEQSSIQTSGKLLHDLIPNSTLENLPGFRHGDLSLNYPEQYAQMLLQMIS